MDKFGMYRRVVQSLGAAEPVNKRQPPPVAGETSACSAKSAGNSDCATKNESNTAENANILVSIEKPVSHSLRAFLESQARHERLSREIDARNGLINTEE